ncbi:MAG: helix-turn-helix domain-containing protein [Cumulibacter sp.]
MTPVLTADTAADPLLCEEFAYGLGPPSGILMLRYRTGETAGFGDTRDDFLHQMYWCRDGQLQVSGSDDKPEWIGPDRAYWAHRSVSHRVFALGSSTVFRAFLREIPPGLINLRHAAVSVTEDARQQIVRLASPNIAEHAWPVARARLLNGLHDLDADGPDTTSVASLVAATLRANPASTRSLDDFAREHHVSPKTLQRDFARTFGCSFSRWRTHTRLEAARDLVGASTVTEIARRVGYSNPSAFVAAFNREYGCTPGRLGSTA